MRFAMATSALEEVRMRMRMRKSIATLALAAFVTLGLLYTGAMTLAHAYVHVSKTVKTPHGVYHKSYTHTKREYVHVSKTVKTKTPHGVYHKGITYHRHGCIGFCP
jgi:hypothetical protein